MTYARRFYALLLILLLPLAGAQEDETPVVVELEAFVIRAAEDGAEETREAAQVGASGQILVPPGEMVEYMLTLRNRGETTLPPGTVILRGPVPATTRYVEGSATPSSDAVRTEFSADGGESFAEVPLQGDAPAAPTDYQVVRWTLLQPLEPGQTVSLVYRVIVAER